MSKKIVFKYGIMIILKESLFKRDADILHYVGYTKEPTFTDYINLYKECSEDASLGLQEIYDDIVLLPASSHVIKYYNSIYEKEQ
jgi:hypothetical protein